MTKRARKRKQATAAPPAKPTGPTTTPLLIAWWALSFALILSSDGLNFGASVPILAAPTTSPLAPTWAWNVPAARLLPLDAFTWPLWLYAVVAATLLLAVARFAARSLPIPLITLIVAVWSATISPSNLVPAALFLVMATTVRGSMSRAGWSSAFAIPGIAVAAVSLTLEFGLVFAVGAVILLCSLLSAPRASLQRRDIITSSVVVVAGIGLLALIDPGFRAALLRPVSVWSLANNHRLLDSTSLPFHSESPWYIPAGLILLLVIGFWYSARDAGVGVTWPAILTAALFGLTSAYYLWLASFVGILLAVAGLPPQTRQDETSRWPAYAWGAACALLLFRSVIAWPTLSTFLLTGNVPARRIDPSTWNGAGPVLLLDLDHSSDWQTPELHERFPLLINDRWDLFGDQYPAYAALCRDLSEGYADHYIRDDGTWGGYLSTLREWTPSLLVTDSRDIQTIRRLSLSPHCNVLGIDSRRTMFGRAEDPETQLPGARAIAELLDLEWPSRGSTDINPQVIVAHQPSDWRQVAEVLCAMRFPYAAFRVMPQDSSTETELLRTTCYLEIAHRVLRETGHIALLDQFRTANRLEHHTVEDSPTARTARRLSRGVAALGLTDLAKAILPGDDSVDAAASTSTSEPLNASAATILLPGIEPASPEALTRLALARGDQAASLEAIAGLDPPQQTYYAIIAKSNERPPEETFAALRRLAESSDFPSQLQGEAWFLLGSLALEVGDAGSALAAFSESRRRDSASPFGPLIDFYLAQLRGRR